MNIRLIPYNIASASCKALQEAFVARGMHCLRVRKDSPTYRHRPSHRLINWGCSRSSVAPRGTINHPDAVGSASDKIETFVHLEIANVPTPMWTTRIEEARSWIEVGGIVVERHVLTGHSGNGIRLVTDPSDLAHAPLYTNYQRKTAEYRVHVLPDGQCLINQKRRRREISDDSIDWQVRNFANGFTYCRDNVDYVDGLESMARAAVQALHLDFGAVDILWHGPMEIMMVLEVNTAPGLSGSLIDEYADAFINRLGVN